MPVKTVAARFEEKRLASASAGLALTTAEGYVTFIPGSNWVSLTPRNFSTAVVARYIFSPWLVVLRSVDALVTEPADLSFLLQDGSTTVAAIMNSFPTLANGGALYIGSHVPFAGLYVDVQNTNSTASTLAAKYYNGGLASLSITDNTDTGASFAQDGTITWTVPTDWQAATFASVFAPAFMQTATWRDAKPQSVVYQDKLYWLRLDNDASFDSTVSVNRIIGLNRSTAYDELASGQSYEQSINTGYGGYSGVQALTDAGTANLLVVNATYGKFQPVAANAL